MRKLVINIVSIIIVGLAVVPPLIGCNNPCNNEKEEKSKVERYIISEHIWENLPNTYRTSTGCLLEYEPKINIEITSYNRNTGEAYFKVFVRIKYGFFSPPEEVLIRRLLVNSKTNFTYKELIDVNSIKVWN